LIQRRGDQKFQQFARKIGLSDSTLQRIGARGQKVDSIIELESATRVQWRQRLNGHEAVVASDHSTT